MAAAILTPGRLGFGSSFSGNHARPNFYSESQSMADSLPSIDFGFEDLRDRMATFTARFDDFIERGRKRVLEERSQFRSTVREIQESQRACKREIETVEDKSDALQDNLCKEVQEQEEIQEAIGQLSTQRQNHLVRRDDLKAQIVEAQKAIHVRRQAQQQHHRQLDLQARHNESELQFWESGLCLRIDGAGVEDRLRFVYTHLGERVWEKECTFELSMGRREFQVIDTEPSLDREAVQALLDRMNETRELAGFLKGMRSLFTDAVRS